jgi:hypothetical protein
MSVRNTAEALFTDGSVATEIGSRVEIVLFFNDDQL